MRGKNSGVFVVGHRGMLGHVVERYFRQRGHEVETTESRYDGRPDDALISAIQASKAPFIVNCLGRIKQKSEDFTELYRSNTLLPLHLAQSLRSDQFLIHASSDCVFSGGRGRYDVRDKPDPDDLYGTSKMLGEIVVRHPQVSVVRASVIGPERGGNLGLMAWFLSQSTIRPVNGFTNHIWNGITTLEWARLAEEIILGGTTPTSRFVTQPGTAPISKYALLGVIRDVYATGHDIQPVEADRAIDRSLIPTDERQSIESQLRDLALWYDVGDAKTSVPLPLDD